MSSEKLYHECHTAVSQGRALLEDLQSWGFSEIYQQPQSESGRADVEVTGEELSSVASPSIVSLADLESSIQGCEKCPLCQSRNSIVFGQGHPGAKLVLVGEAPGREEDKRGVPFVGEAGQLLEKILYAMGLQREDVYICNIIKCRPPNNRDPQGPEIAACETYLQHQLRLIKPRIIVTLGRFAAHALLQCNDPISRLRGHWSEYQNIPVMPTYHPAYLLRNPVGKREVWSDMKQVVSRLKD